MTEIPEPVGRYRRCCPYCHAPVTWRYFGGAADVAPVERPSCRTHGPLVLWRVVDFDHPRGGAWVVAVGHISEEIGGRLLVRPVAVRSAHQASARWKRATRPVTGAEGQLRLLPIDLSRLSLRRAA